jgi:hypothetical protein
MSSSSDEETFFEPTVVSPRSSSSPSSTTSSASSSSSSKKKSHPRRGHHEFTATASASRTLEATIPDTVITKKKAPKKPSSASSRSSASSSAGPDPSLLRHMAAGLAAGRREGRAGDSSSERADDRRDSDVFKHNLLASIAEDEELSRSIHPDTVMTASAVARIGKAGALDVEAIAKAISRSQCVCLCFLMDTTGSMASHISGVKKQVQEIVKNVRDSGCRVNSLAFIGYKDWCDGHDHFEVCCTAYF